MVLLRLRQAFLAAALVLAVAASAAPSKLVDTQYTPILRSNAKIGNYPFTFGQILTKDMKPVFTTDDAGMPTKVPLISNEPDFSSLHKANGKLYLIVQFESPRPGSMYIVELNQDKKNGTLSPKSLKYVNFAGVHGLWIPCGGSVTPWGGRLAGEEYEPDARPMSEATDFDSLVSLYGGDWGDVEGFMAYYNLYPAQLNLNRMKANFNPYRYGHIVETRITPTGSVKVEKWYTLGRAAFEMAYALPNRRTVYMTDDGDNVGFFKFQADKPDDLSSGTLFAAKFTQTSGIGGGVFTITWIPLGKGKNAELKALAETTTFADIFETAEYDDESQACPAGFKSINQDSVGVECLKVKPGMAKAAAFLESRRYAALKGATTEFSKWEGITFDAKRGKLYTAMSAIRNGMENNAVKGKPESKFDIGGNNHIRLQYNKCGCVYEIPVDKSGSATGMKALVCGRINPDKADEANGCALDGIASPDNVAYAPQMDSLLIGEDTSEHESNVMWAFDLKTRTLDRVLSAPYGAEVTSTYWHFNVNNFAYALAVIQHPYSGFEETKLMEKESSGIDGWVGSFIFKTSDLAGVRRADWDAITYSDTNEEKHDVRSSEEVRFIKQAGKVA